MSVLDWSILAVLGEQLPPEIYLKVGPAVVVPEFLPICSISNAK